MFICGLLKDFPTAAHPAKRDTAPGMAVTCDHRIRSLATINKKAGFGPPLRPQNVIFADRANQTSTMNLVTCDHNPRSPVTKNWNHLARVGGGVAFLLKGVQCSEESNIYLRDVSRLKGVLVT